MDRLARTVREQVALGRLLPLGVRGDAVWITERAAVAALRAQCAALSGVRLGAMAVLPGDADTDPGDAPDGVSEAAPLGALPHQALRIEAEFEAAVDDPLPVAADRLRALLLDAATRRLGLSVETVDLAVTGLLDDDAVSATPGGEDRATSPDSEPEVGPEPGPVFGPEVGEGADEATEAAVRAVPGVLRLTRRLAGHGGVRVRDTRPPAEPARLVQLQIATGSSYVALDVAREAATAAGSAVLPGAPGPVHTAVVVTDVD